MDDSCDFLEKKPSLYNAMSSWGIKLGPHDGDGRGHRMQWSSPSDYPLSVLHLGLAIHILSSVDISPIPRRAVLTLLLLLASPSFLPTYSSEGSAIRG